MQKPIDGLTIKKDVKYRVFSRKNQFYVDGELKHTFISTTIQPPDSWVLLVARSNGTAYSGYAKCKLFGCRIWDNDVLVRNFIPCCNKSNGQIGLYDLVTGMFYENAGTGSFGGA